MLSQKGLDLELELELWLDRLLTSFLDESLDFDVGPRSELFEVLKWDECPDLEVDRIETPVGSLVL